MAGHEHGGGARRSVGSRCAPHETSRRANPSHKQSREGASPGVGEIAALVEQFPGIEADLRDVADWIGCDPALADFAFDVIVEPASVFAERVQGMLETYSEFPKDAARTRKIVAALKRGEPQRPVFVDARDGFLLEGRHRIVAFHLAGLAEVPTVYVRRRTLDDVPEDAEPTP